MDRTMKPTLTKRMILPKESVDSVTKCIRTVPLGFKCQHEWQQTVVPTLRKCAICKLEKYGDARHVRQRL